MASGAVVPPDVPPHPPRERLQIIKHIVTKGGVNENGNVLTFICKVEGASSLSLVMSVLRERQTSIAQDGLSFLSLGLFRCMNAV